MVLTRIPHRVLVIYFITYGIYLTHLLELEYRAKAEGLQEKEEKEKHQTQPNDHDKLLLCIDWRVLLRVWLAVYV